MSGEWDDFQKPSANISKKDDAGQTDRQSPDNGCTWGQVNDARLGQDDCDAEDSISTKFIPLYEKYLNDKKSLLQQTSNFKTYMRDPQKELRDWFENDGHDFEPIIDQVSPGQFVCTLDLPIEDQDFTLTSESYAKKKAATDEVCLDACRMLDFCHLLYSEQSAQISPTEELANKRKIAEANKEDDIVFDKTIDIKRQCFPTRASDNICSNTGIQTNRVNTYESLMAKWTALNMSLLQSKAKLVKLDLSVKNKQQTKGDVKVVDEGNEVVSRSLGNDSGSRRDDSAQDSGDEVDPLDEFMSSLNTKTKLNMEDKIEKSRLKSQIALLERQQTEVARLLELAKPNTSKLGLGGNSSKQ